MKMLFKLQLRERVQSRLKCLVEKVKLSEIFKIS